MKYYSTISMHSLCSVLLQVFVLGQAESVQCSLNLYVCSREPLDQLIEHILMISLTISFLFFKVVICSFSPTGCRDVLFS